MASGYTSLQAGADEGPIEQEWDAEAQSEAPAAGNDVPWDCIDVLVRGAPLLKFGRQGDPHFRDFQLSLDCLSLAWASSKKASGETSLILKGCMLIEGQSSDVFARQPRPDLADVSFTLVYDDPTAKRGTKRTLDVACKNRTEFEAWYTALAYLSTQSPPEALLEARRRTLWSDVVPLVGSEAGRPAASNTRITQALKRRLKDGNDVVGWGRCGWGELGMGDEMGRLEPTMVPSLLGKAIRTVSVGSSHCIALSLSGDAYAWGQGGSGRLGTGGSDHELAPRQLLQQGGREPWRFRAVACGDMHTLAVSQEGGRAYAWGAGGVGQCGAGSREDRLCPSPVPAFLAGVYPAMLATGGRTHGRSMADPAAGLSLPAPAVGSGTGPARSRFQSSADAFGGVGAFGMAAVTAPVSLQAVLPSIVSVAAGAGYSAFVDTTGRLFTCGIQDGPLGHDVPLIARLLGQTDTSAHMAVAARGDSDSPSPSPSVTGTARAYAAALDFAGGGATTATSDLLAPVQVMAGIDASREQVIFVTCGELHAAIATSTGVAYSWGWGGAGALGHGDLLDRSVPTRITGLPRDVVQLAAGAAHTLALVEHRSSGASIGVREVYGFGSIAYGQVPVPGGEGEEGGATGQGKKKAGHSITLPRLLRLPLPPLDEHAEPGTPPPSPIAVAAGSWHSAVVLSNSTLLVCGSGRDGELGLTEASATASVKLVGEWERARGKASGVQSGGSTGGNRSRLAMLGMAVGTFVSGAKPKGAAGSADDSTLSGSTATTGPRSGPAAPRFTISQFTNSLESHATGLLAQGQGSGDALASGTGSLDDSSLHPDRRPAPHAPPIASMWRTLSPGASSSSIGPEGEEQDKEAGGMKTSGGSAGVMAGSGGAFQVRPMASDADAARDDNDLRPRSISMAHRYFSRREGTGAAGASRGTQDEGNDDVDEDDEAVGGEVLSAAGDRPSSALSSVDTRERLAITGGTGGDGITLSGLQQSVVSASGDVSSGASGSSGDKDKEKERERQPLACTLLLGPLPVVSLLRREVRAVACGNGFTVATVATEWMRNEDASACMRCSASFTSVTRRKHHCRQCGGVFCERCSGRRIPLLNLGYIEPVRVCDGCYARRISES